MWSGAGIEGMGTFGCFDGISSGGSLAAETVTPLQCPTLLKGKELFFMIPIKVSYQQIREAEVRARKVGVLRGSIRGGGGNVAGFIGEIVMRDSYGWRIVDTYEYDMMTPEGKRVDIKTKERRVQPMGHYLATVKRRQTCDIYVFCSYDRVEQTLWVCGWMESDEFHKVGMDVREGDVDPEKPGWRFKADCCNVRYDQLNQFELVR